MKLCLFLQGSKEIVDSGYGKQRVTRRGKARKQQTIKEHILQLGLDERMTKDEIDQLCQAENTSKIAKLGYFESENKQDNPEKLKKAYQFDNKEDNFGSSGNLQEKNINIEEDLASQEIVKNEQRVYEIF